MEIRKYTENDIPSMIRIWNHVVEEGVAFPQEEILDDSSAKIFFSSQSFCGVAVEKETVVGLYILHPNYIGRLSSIANASYAVDFNCRGKHIGEKLVLDCLLKAKEFGFKILQFNAVVENNIHARHLYERLGFIHLGTIPQAFRMKDGSFESICIYYHKL